jgi:solute carrier family 25 phosphate transporter 3
MSQLYRSMGRKPLEASDKERLAVSMSSGVVAGIAGAVASHPADVLLSLINKNKGAGGEGSVTTRLMRLAREVGPKRLLVSGLAARCWMVGGYSAAQFAIFDSIMAVTGAEKFYFRDPTLASGSGSAGH